MTIGELIGKTEEQTQPDQPLEVLKRAAKSLRQAYADNFDCRSISSQEGLEIIVSVTGIDVRVAAFEGDDYPLWDDFNSRAVNTENELKDALHQQLNRRSVTRVLAVLAKEGREE
jgi:hypothetical protein